MKKVSSGFVLASLFFAASLAAQVNPPSAAPNSPAPPSTQRQTPCWQLAGVSRSAMRQRRMIVRNMHNQIQLVCANFKLSAQQREQRIDQIRADAQAHMRAFLSVVQIDSINSCRARRASIRGDSNRRLSEGPCRDMPMNGSPSDASGDSQQPAPVANEPVD